MNILLRIAAWSVLILITIVTVAPIGFRPHIGEAFIERAVAFGLLGFLFAVAYPRRALLVVAIVVFVAGMLEVFQQVEPSRHARLVDFGIKLISGLAGVAIGLGAPRHPRRN
jgi:hypothetical protein